MFLSRGKTGINSVHCSRISKLVTLIYRFSSKIIQYSWMNAFQGTIRVNCVFRAVNRTRRVKFFTFSKYETQYFFFFFIQRQKIFVYFSNSGTDSRKYLTNGPFIGGTYSSQSKEPEPFTLKIIRIDFIIVIRIFFRW